MPNVCFMTKNRKERNKAWMLDVEHLPRIGESITVLTPENKVNDYAVIDVTTVIHEKTSIANYIVLLSSKDIEITVEDSVNPFKPAFASIIDNHGNLKGIAAKDTDVIAS